jgi:hypothetical protein
VRRSQCDPILNIELAIVAVLFKQSRGKQNLKNERSPTYFRLSRLKSQATLLMRFELLGLAQEETKFLSFTGKGKNTLTYFLHVS